MLATLLLLADLAGTIVLADRTEARVRAPGTGRAAASFDLETAPTVGLQLASRRLHIMLAYAPRLTLWDAGTSGAQPTLLHGGAARLEWQSVRTRLSLDQTGGYGLLNLAAVPLAAGADGAPPRAEPLPGAALILFASTTTTLGARLSRGRWTVDLSAGYQQSGGADRAARALLPFETGPFAGVTVDCALSRRDRLATTVSASSETFSSGPASVLGEVDETFRRLLTRVTEARFTLGVSAARVQNGETAPPRWETYPVAEAVVEHHPLADGLVGARLGVRLGPVVNRLIGLVDERVEASLAVSYTRRRLTARLLASGAQSVPAGGPNATRVLVGQVGAEYGASHLVALDLGLRGIWQSAEIAGAGFLQATLFFGVALRAPPIRL